jgi:hypothetical protein
MSKKVYLAAAVGLLATAVACSEKSSSPAAPSSSPAAVDDAGALADGTTLKVTAPTQTSPANGATLDQFEITLKVNPSVARFAPEVTQFAYRFQLLLNGQVVKDFRTSSSTEWKVTELDNNVTYGWRCRAEQGTYFGPWSATWTFKTPEQPEGYNIPGELYDPLYTGKTVGNPNGSVDFVPGVGIRLNDFTSHVEYVLPETIRQGEISVLVTNTPANTEGGKTKIMSMREGRSDITTNDRRFTIEKRGDPPGTIAFRIITRDSQEETQGAERVQRNFLANKWYLWRASFRNGRFQLEIFEDGANGQRIYSFGKNYEGFYDPSPHLAYIGSPVGRGGPSDATIPGMIAKQLWISNRPRPAFANK